MNRSPNKWRVIVVGGGPAGLIAAGEAAALGAETLLLEKMSEPGRKLRITGKGRCNLTNIAPLRDFIPRFGKKGKFLHQAFHRFFSPDLAAFLGEIGVDIKTERGGRVFPAGENAPAVAEALIAWVEQQGVTIKRASAVQKLLTKDNCICGVSVGGQQILADTVILATGGASYPATGSTGDGYQLAKTVGHTIIPPRPALVPLVTAGDIAPRLQGLSLRNVKVSVFIEARKKDEAFGEMLFTHYGLSGPIILSLSGDIVDQLDAGKKVTLSIDLKPALNDQQLDARLLRELQTQGKRQFQTILKSLLPGKLIEVCPDLVGISADKPGNQISSNERVALRRWLKDMQFTITGHRSFKEAIVTAGGINTKEIDPATMESRKIAGLYMAGELIDINGDTGGFNLQAAFSTGWLAGHSAARRR